MEVWPNEDLLNISDNSIRLECDVMKRYADTFFRSWLVALVPIFVLPMAFYMILRGSTNQVPVSAHIWVDRSSIQQIGDTDPYASSAQNMTNYMNQLLQTSAFDLTVAKMSPLYGQQFPAQMQRDGVMAQGVRQNMQVAPLGSDLLIVTFMNKNGLVGEQVVRGFLSAVPQEIRLLSKQTAVKALQYDKSQLKDAQRTFDSYAGKMRSYLKSHHISAAGIDAQRLIDPKFASLYLAVQSAQSNVQSAQQQASLAVNQRAVSGTIRVIDPPGVGSVKSSKKKTLLNLIVGFAFGLLLSATFIVVRTALDRTVRFVDEVPVFFGLPVLGVMPHRPSLAVASHPRSVSDSSDLRRLS
jgi:hypothetical protein